MERKQKGKKAFTASGGTADLVSSGKLTLDDLLKNHSMTRIGECRTVQTHIIVCPFCEIGHPVPMDFDAIHKCSCGACYKVCGSQSLENGVSDIADELWTEEEMDFIRAVPVDFCNIIVEKDFDRLLDLKHALDTHGVARFCKYDINVHLNLVWVKRLF